MKSSLNKVFLLFVLSVLSVNVSASVILEPILGFRMLGKSEIGSDEEEYSALIYGGRLGVPKLIPGMILGIDYRMGSYESEDDAGATSEYDAKYLGAFVSYVGLPLLNFWGTWFFKHDNEIQLTQQILKGSGFNLGIGYKMLPLISVNLEFSKYTLDEVEDSNGNTVSPFPLAAQGNEVTGREFILSISVPISL